MGAKRDFALIKHGHLLSELDDLAITSPADNSVLQYDSASGTWQDVSLSSFNSQLDHGALLGLADDDHTQYHDDARALTWLGTRSTTDLPEGTRLYFTDERAQDAVGASLTDSTTIDFTYNDGANTITAAVIQSFAYEWSGTHGWADNSEIQLGTGNDLRLYHDGTNSLIRNDTGALRLQGGANVGLEIASTGALSSAQNATWSGDHIFTNGFALSSAQPEAFWIETDAAADNGVWGALVAGTSFRLSAFSDNLATEVSALTIARSGTALGTMTIGGAGYSGFAVSLLSDVTTPLTVTGTTNSAYSLVFDNDSNGTTNACRIVFNSGDASGAFFTAGSGRTSSVLTGGPTGAQGVIRMLGAYPLILGTNNTAYFQIPADGGMAIVDGITAPATLSGWAKIYVDSADGDLKIKFGDGTVKTIVTDT